MLKKHMTPLTKGGAKVAHKGKGSHQAAMPNRKMIGQLASPNSTFNDYAKATPMPQGTDPDGDGDFHAPMPMPPGLGG